MWTHTNRHVHPFFAIDQFLSDLDRASRVQRRAVACGPARSAAPSNNPAASTTPGTDTPGVEATSESAATVETTAAASPAPAERRQVVRPRVDIREADEAWTLLVDVPGVQAADLEVEWQSGILTVRGLRNVETGPAVEYAHQFRLPRTVDADRVSVQLKDGVARIEIPRLQDERRRIPVAAAQA